MTCLDLKLIGHILRTSYFYCHAKVQFHGHWSLSYFLAFYVECHISLLIYFYCIHIMSSFDRSFFRKIDIYSMLQDFKIILYVSILNIDNRVNWRRMLSMKSCFQLKGSFYPFNTQVHILGNKNIFLWIVSFFCSFLSLRQAFLQQSCKTKHLCLYNPEEKWL